MKYLVFVLFLVGCGSQSSNSEVKSGYPSTYPIHSDHAQVGPIAIDRNLQSDGGIGLYLRYSGNLKGQQDLSLYVKVNYEDGTRDALIPMTYSNHVETVFRLSNMCLVGELGGCAKGSTDAMRHLLFWASGHRGLNALDIEFAVVNGRNNWDSNYGENYRVKFQEYHRY